MSDEIASEPARVHDPRGLQVLRLPAALAVLALVGQLRPSIAQTMGLYAGPAASYTTAWFRIVLVAAVFMLIVAVGRRPCAPIALLLVEAAAAATFGFVPPYLWGAWLNHHPFSFVLGFELVAPLAIAWFAICITALGRCWRRRGRREALSSGSGSGALRPPLVNLAAHVRGWLGWLRVPALLGTLVLVASRAEELARAASTSAFTAAWVPLTLAVLAFMMVAMVGRRQVPGWLLAIELVLAGTLALIPRFPWLTWLGSKELASALSSQFIMPLAIAWFAVALVAWFETRREFTSGRTTAVALTDRRE